MKELSLLCVALLLAAVVAANQPTYEEHKKNLGLKFSSPEEDAYRASVYASNVRLIQANNNDPKSTHKEGVNIFTTMTQAQFAGLMLTARAPTTIASKARAPRNLGTTGWTTVNVDWTATAGAVTPIRNQGQCGSCYAFSACAAMESLNFLKGAGAIDLSEQQLVSCSGAYGNKGCNGGWPNNAFKYAMAVGITVEALYPYTATNSACTSNGGAFKISGIIPVTAATNLCTAVANALVGRPLSVVVDATNWQSYSSGVLSSCGTSSNHAVLLVGVNTNYYKIKNSWGISWGESGFIRLNSVGGANTCAVCSLASYPTK